MNNSFNISIYLILIIVSVISFGCAKDAPSPNQKDNFIKFYENAYYNSPTDVIEVENSYYLLINHTDNDEKTSFFIQNVDAYGNTIAKQQFFGDNNQNLWGGSLVSLSDGQIAVVGYTNSDLLDVDSLYTDIYLLIVNNELALIKDTVYNEAYIEKGFLIAEMNNGGLLIYGTQKDPATDVIRRIHRPLNEQLEIVNPGQDGEISSEKVGYLSPLTNGEFLIAGNVFSTPHFVADVLRLNEDGVSDNDYLSDINGFYNQVLPLNNEQILICGTNYNGSIGAYDGYVALYEMDTDATIWEKDLGGTQNDEAKSIALTNDDCILVAGYQTDNVGVKNISIVKLNMQGELLKEVLLGGGNSEQSIKIFSHSNNANAFTVCGISERDESSSTVFIASSFD